MVAMSSNEDSRQKSDTVRVANSKEIKILFERFHFFHEIFPGNLFIYLPMEGETKEKRKMYFFCNIS